MEQTDVEKPYGSPDPTHGQPEAALRDLAERSFEGLPVGVAIFAAPSGRIIYANPKLAALLQIPTSALMAQSSDDFERFAGAASEGRPLEPEDLPAARALRGEVVENAGLILPRGDGSAVPVRVWATPIWGRDHHVEAAVVTVLEASHPGECAAAPDEMQARYLALIKELVRRQKVGKRLAEQRRLLEAVFSATTDLLLAVDANGRFLLANPAARQRLGSEAVGLHYLEAARRLDLRDENGRRLQPAEMASLFKEATTAGRRTIMQFGGPGATETMEINASPLTLGGGRTGAIVICRDVGAQQEYLARLRQEKTRALALADRLSRLNALTMKLSAAHTDQEVVQVIIEHAHAALPDGVVSLVAVLTEDGRHLQIPASRGIGEAARRRWDRFSVADALPMAESVRTGEPVYLRTWAEFERRFPWAAGELKEESMGMMQATAALPLRLHGTTIGSIGFTYATPQSFPTEDREFLSTIATQCVLALERSKLLADAYREAQDRERFIAILAHDLRTPLAVMRLSTGTLLRSALPESCRVPLTRMGRAVTRMATMVDDLLDFASVRGGRLTLRVRPCDLEEITRLSIDEAHQADPDGQVNLERFGDVSGEWDPLRLQQAIGNLLVNALRYRDPGSAVHVRLKGSDDAVTLQVHNRGEPIPAELLSHLFEPFRRGRTGEQRSARGLGLGLFIAREIARAHGGRVEVASNREDGTCFSVWLPRRPPSPPA